MAEIFWMMCLSLLTQGFWCILGDIEVGCKKWSPIGDTFVCNECHPGNYLAKKHGRTPTELCTLCENGTFTEKTDDKECYICRQCVGALVHLKDCTPKSDTQCACKKGLVCGNEKCTYCVDECGKGYEPDSNNRSCRPCPEGTFNDKIHQKCKPFSTSCADPNHIMVFKGNSSSDIVCELLPPLTIPPATNPDKSENKEQAWPSELFGIIGGFMMCLIIFIVLVSVLLHHNVKKRKTQRTPSKTPIIRTPTDDPRTLIAIECSFHEAQQEQGNSTESLISKDSSEQETV
ncbi:hypothetical protein XENORESO_012144 [Xenotaenia resolanae]|uniref:TNFR-Cys domain-containing protein n=1 Tax=Xenotaenia resolanae TaxID=208358 RepID=A0ABV0VXA9_9TELE